VPVIYTLMQEWFVAARYRCDGVITAVDATHAAQQLTTHREAVRQVAMADRLLITKGDLADSATRAVLDERLDALNPGAPRIEVNHGQVSPDALFGCGIYTPAGKLPDVAAWLGEEQVRDQQQRLASIDAPVAWREKGGRAKHAHSHVADRHDELVSSFVVNFAQPVQWYGFTAAMGRILETHGPQLLRVKGLMNIVGDPLPRVIHCVQDVAYPPVSLARWPTQSPFEDHCGRLVFIVHDLPRAAADAIQAALTNVSTEAATPARIAACPLPTKCWLTHNTPGMEAGSAPSAIQVDGWTVQIKGLARR
jgi:G3E family GTPase